MKVSSKPLKEFAAESMYRWVGVSYNGTKRTMEDLKESMRHEMCGSVFLSVEGFWKKYFMDPTWSGQSTNIADLLEMVRGNEAQVSQRAG